jgi:hypothetical protein
MYERVAMIAIPEQQEHHAAAERLEAVQAKSMQAHREKSLSNSKKSKAFKEDGSSPKLTVRSVELV